MPKLDALRRVMAIEELQGVPNDRWDREHVGNHMRTDLPAANLAMSRRDVLTLMEGAGVDLLPVVDGETFVGVITTTEILKLEILALPAAKREHRRRTESQVHSPVMAVVNVDVVTEIDIDRSASEVGPPTQLTRPTQPSGTPARRVRPGMPVRRCREISCGRTSWRRHWRARTARASTTAQLVR